MTFNKKLFNKGWAIYFTVLQYVTVVGFTFMVVAVILGATNLPIDISIPTFAVILLFASFVLFPIVSIIKIGYRRNMKWSRITEKNGSIIYDKLAEKMWTAVGHVEEHHIYKITSISSVQQTKRYYIVNGTIEKKVINNGRTLSVDKCNFCKIKNAYTGLKYLKTKCKEATHNVLS